VADGIVLNKATGITDCTINAGITTCNIVSGRYTFVVRDYKE
jgi:hypothetical protein